MRISFKRTALYFRAQFLEKNTEIFRGAKALDHN